MSPKKRDAGRPLPFWHVALATDFSVGAALAARRTALLPIHSKGAITLIHVLPDLLRQKLAAQAREDASRRLREAQRSLTAALADERNGSVTVGAQLIDGHSYSAIVSATKSIGADLLVIGRHGPRPFRDLFIGSTAERVVRLAALPVLVVTGRPHRKYRRSVIGVDLGETSPRVVSAALRLFGAEAGEAALVHAYRTPFDSLLTPSRSQQAREESREAAERGLASLSRTLDRTGMSWARAAVHGDARAAILAQAKRRLADVIVVGSHVERGLVRGLLGSTAEGVLRGAPCDVLVART